MPSIIPIDNKFTRSIFLIIGVMLFSSCASVKEIAPPRHMGAWLVYWDGERGLSELEAQGGLFDRVSLFAYELDVNGNPQPAPHFKELLPHFLDLSRKKGFEPWVTVVNDFQVEGDKALPKDVQLLKRILSDPELRRNHAASLAEKVSSDGFVGLDLDYECLTVSDQNNFRNFVSELSQELQRRNLRLNVVLEPQQGPLPFPGTEDLTVMGYYLHGEHNGPGPIATPDFISKLNQRLSGNTSGSHYLALSLGGFSWSPERKVSQVDWDSGQKLTNGVKVKRDSLTGVPYALLEDGTEVWFEDPESLQRKWEAAEKADFSGLMLWRLGGNDYSLFQLLQNYRNRQQRGNR